ERIFSISIAAPAMTELLTPAGPFSDIRVSPDGGSLAYVASRVDGPSPHDLFVASFADRRPRNVTGAAIDRPVTHYMWRKDGSIFVVTEDGFRDAAWSVESSGRPTRLAAPGMTLLTPALDPGGHAWFIGHQMDRLPEIYEWDLAAAPVARTRINESFASAALVRPEIVHYASFDGRTIEGALLMPG